MKRTFKIEAPVPAVVLFGIVFSIGMFQVACNNAEPSKTETVAETKELSQADKVSRGAYLVTIGLCSDCHSPKIFTPTSMGVDSARMLSGHPEGSKLPPIDIAATKPGTWALMQHDGTAFVGPWGVSFSANLTPDSATGLGAWSEDVFIRTLKTGKHLGQPAGRDILPPMPWYLIGRMTDEDLSSVYAYLQSLPAIKNRVPAPVPPNEVGKLATR